MNIRIASWNVNSVNARLENLLFWLKETKPDIVLLQEIKCLEEKFPFSPIEELGYNVVANGQKSYNGVAILSKFPLEDVVKTLPSYGIDQNDEQARYIEAVALLPKCAIRVSSIYVPNGGAELLNEQKVNETEKFIYKMNFFDRLKIHFKKLLEHDEIAIFGGDYNIAINNIDAYNPKALKDKICFHLDEKKKFRSLLNLGYADSFRAIHPQTQNFSWWDYRGNSWQYNKGLRIDYLLLSPKATDCLVNASMDDELMMAREKTSDHCPVIAEISF